jgi:hypothetical protein
VTRPISTIDGPDAPDTATILRRGILGLGALGVAGTLIELVFLGHWSNALQAVVWPALAVLAIGLLVMARGPSAAAIQRVRALALVVAAVAALGIGVHAWANVDAGALDKDVAATWGSMPAVQHWWLGITGAVGPAPTLAPGVLAEISFALALATVRHPALAETRARPVALAVDGGVS